MKWIVRLAALLASLLGGLTLIDLQHRTSSVFLYPVKALATAFAPLLALIGVASALSGLRRRDPIAAAAGVAGAFAATRYVMTVTRPHVGFDEAFGAEWQQRIPGPVGERCLPRRYTPLVRSGPADWQRDIVYGASPATSQPLLADLWQPPVGAERSGLGVIYVHGGAWRIGQKDMGTRPFFRRLARHGHVVLDIEYTQAPAGDLPGMVCEVKQAIAWLKEHADRYGVNPQRIVLIGSSAGAHLALLAAYTPNDPAFQPPGLDVDTSVHAVVAYYAPVDLLEVYQDVEKSRERLMQRARFGPYKRSVEEMLHLAGLLPARTKIELAENYIAQLLGASPEEQPELYRRLSPSSHVGPHCPPTLLLQGASDVFGMARSVERLHQALRQAGVLSILVRFPNTDHAFDLFLPQISPVAQAATYDVERFLALMC